MSKASNNNNNLDKGGGNSSDTKVGGLTSTGSTKKSGRKISLPWFRQSSVPSHATLARQHTIDSPGSFQFLRKGGLSEMTWVLADHTAAPGSSELSVSKGQQVEIVDMNCSGAPDFYLVRLPSAVNATDSQEGMVPVAVLKPLPSSHSKLNNKQRDTDTLGEVPQENDCILPNQHTSPVNKRKGFSGITMNSHSSAVHDHLALIISKKARRGDSNATQIEGN
uniref:SH3 domain-containing protein n=1 Tax=Anopheles farauti TaxID=69004 RepID=A0A182QYF8_9DIPT